MELRVVGCHGGQTPTHRTSAFVIDDRLAVDAGSLAAGLDLKLQLSLEGCIISHAHLDHIKELAMVADNRCQAECEPLLVGASKATIKVLSRHIFNNLVYPDFTTIPTPNHPTIRFVELRPQEPRRIAGYAVESVPVNHTIPTTGFIIRGPDSSLAYTGDTGPTDRLWELLRAEKNLRALLHEVSFPNQEQKLATVSGHHTPATLREDLRKYGHPQDLPTLLFHIKPFFQRQVERECARLKGVNVIVLATDDQFVL
ncbi:MAG: 3',5'-cyclic-nucleotide phosphodiesterase [Polyangiaceae bacterium]|nr:3',5'-cyclic-nucleotide phosphodiesterase [Polyangiaceae bacterium]